MASPSATLTGLPQEIQEKIFKLVVIILDEDTGKPIRIDLHATKAYKTRLFSIAQLSKSINQAFGNLAFENNTFTFNAFDTDTGKKHSINCISYCDLSMITWGPRSHGEQTQCFGMAFPPIEARRHLKHVQFILPYPAFWLRPGTTGLSLRVGIPDPLAWLHPLRVLKELGFGGLETLTVTADAREWYHDRAPEFEKLLERAKAQVASMDLDAKEVKVDVITKVADKQMVKLDW